jgi:DNA-directed RNA polymerase subunit beta'
MANKVSSFQRKIAKVKVGLTSKDKILEWSNGEVKKPETLNHRTSKPEKEGLFCEKIFGPTKDYECACGKYKGKKYEGTVCERCGVRIESKESRRRKMGHIELATPVSHIWYLKSAPSVLSVLLNISVKDLENIIYYGSKRVVERAYITLLDETEEKEFDYYPGEIHYQREYELYSQYMDIKTEPAVKIVRVKGLPITDISGKVSIDSEMTNTEREIIWIKVEDEDGQTRKYPIFEGASLMVETDQEVEEGTPLADRFLFEEDFLTHSEYTLFSEYYPGMIEIERDVERDTPIVVITEIDKRFSKRIGKKVGEILLEDEAFAYQEIMKILNTKVKKQREEIVDKILAENIKIEEKLYDKGIIITQEIVDEMIESNIKDVLARDEKGDEKLYQINRYDTFIASYGASAVKKLLQELDLEITKAKIEKELDKLDKRSQKALKLLKRLKLIKDFLRSGNNPEWVVVDVLPVVPPDLRPLIQIDGGRFAATDLNDLYRKVINRNNRLKKLMEMEAPEIIVRNEKRILQQAVDSLIYNGRVGKATTDRSKRPLRSLTDLLKGKKGRFRRNLLGKRVDYSGRAVITVGPEMKIHECGLPKKMALELFKPFVLSELLKDSNVASKNARKLKKTIIEKEMPQAWEILEEVIKGHPVLLNRAPTLHRISIQAFIPRLIEGNAIRLHPLVCPPFNADFDGDQMAVHVPLSAVSQAEAKFLMLSRYNIISPANGHPISMPGKDMIAGTYYLTNHVNKDFETLRLPKNFTELKKKDKKIISRVFANEMEAEYVYEYNKVLERGICDNEGVLVWKKSELSLHDLIGFRYNNDKIIKSTVGKIIFNKVVPEDLRDYSKKMDKKALKKLLFNTFKKYGIDRTAELLDDIKDFGFHYSTISGFTISIRDVVVSPKREAIIKNSEQEVFNIEKLFEEGYLTDNERYKEIIRIWEKSTKDVTEVTDIEYRKHTFNPIWMMVDSGARGTIDQLKQLAGMRGLMADPAGKIIEVPIKSNFKSGLSELEFFTSTHGSRKGSADTALRTATAGYLTRRLVDVAQSITITETDCGTHRGIVAEELWSDGSKIEDLSEFLFGRVLAKEVLDPETDKIIVNSKNGKEYVRDVMLDEEDGEFLSQYNREIEVSEVKELKLNEMVETLHYEVLEEVKLEDSVIVEVGEQLTIESAEELMMHNIENLKVKEYKVVDFVYTGDDIYVEDENQKSVCILKYQEKIDIKNAKTLERYKIEKVSVRPFIFIRSVLTCESEDGICSKCYGMDLSNHKIVNIGEAIGVIAAQSIGEPGTQLTMRTFHTGGIATTSDITQGLPRAEELFEARKKLKGSDGTFADVKGIVKSIVRDEDTKVKKLLITVEDSNGELKTYNADYRTKPVAYIGDRVLPGDRLTTGNIKPRSVLKDLGVWSVSTYLLKEIKKIYAEQGVDIHDKHFEIIIRQMLNKIEVVEGGDTHLMPGDLLPFNKAIKINEEILEENSRISENRENAVGKKLARRVIIPSDIPEEEDEIIQKNELINEEKLVRIIEAKIKEVEVFEEYEEKENEDGEIEIIGTTKAYLINPKNPLKYERKLLRITKASLEREGWLSAASFQQTVQILTEASIEGKEDYLKGLKENVIVGQPIPAGTGLKMYSDITYENTKVKEEVNKEKDII